MSRFLERFLPLTTIQADAGEVVFRRGTKEARAEPLIRINENGKITAIGKSAATPDAGRLVRLFEPEGATNDAEMRAFCRSQLALVAGASLLRPQVRIVEPSFRRAFGRQASGTLLRVLQADGLQAEIVDASL